MQTRGNFEVDIFDLIDVRGDLPDTMRLSKSRNLPPQQSGFVKTSVKLLTPMGVEIRVEGEVIQRDFPIHVFTLKFFAEKPDEAFNDVKIFIFSPKRILNKGKFIEKQLTRDSRGGVWICEMADVSLTLNDNIEYWIYVEKSNLGYFTSQILAVQGNLYMIMFHKSFHCMNKHTTTNKGINFQNFVKNKIFFKHQ